MGCCSVTPVIFQYLNLREASCFFRDKSRRFFEEQRVGKSFHCLVTRLQVRVSHLHLRVTQASKEEPQGLVTIWEKSFLGGKSGRLFFPMNLHSNNNSLKPPGNTSLQTWLAAATSKAGIRDKISGTKLRLHEAINPGQKKLPNSESPSLQTRISGTNKKAHYFTGISQASAFSITINTAPAPNFGLSYWWKLWSELQIQHRPVFKHPKPSSKARKFNGMIMLRAIEGSFFSKQQSTLTLRSGICYDNVCLPRATTMCTEVLLLGERLDTACWWEAENKSFVFLCFCAQPLVLLLLNCLYLLPLVFFILFSPLPPCPDEEGLIEWVGGHVVSSQG